eukprot:6214010-Pleurochrysis_carterae.AAC.1
MVQRTDTYGTNFLHQHSFHYYFNSTLSYESKLHQQTDAQSQQNLCNQKRAKVMEAPGKACDTNRLRGGYA